MVLLLKDKSNDQSLGDYLGPSEVLSLFPIPWKVILKENMMHVSMELGLTRNLPVFIYAVTQGEDSYSWKVLDQEVLSRYMNF